jgi:membrane fusion protein, hemolysin D
MRSSRFVPARRLEPAPEQLIRQYQSETDEIRAAPEPLQARLTLFAAAGLFFALIGIALAFKLDRVVTSEFGQVVSVEPTVVLQALDASIIKSIAVKDGQQVKKGQLIATLDPTFAAADVAALRLQIASLEAEIGRCQAELTHQPFDMPVGTLPEAARYEAIQKNYYDERKAQFDAQIRSYDEQIAEAKSTLVRLSSDQALYADRAKLAKEIEAMHAKLAADRVGSELELLVATDQKLEMQRNADFDQNSIVETEHQLKSTAANRDAFIQQWMSQVSLELVNARNQLDAAREQLDKAAKHKDLVRITAPDNAVVLRLAKLSVGSVLKEGDTFATLARLHSPLQAEVTIDPRNIGFIRVGDPATIKFDAYDFIEHGSASGKVLWISDGTFATDPVTGATADAQGNSVPPYYQVRIGFTKLALRNVPADFRLLPGTTLSADIHVGTRSAFMYMMGGLLRGMNEAMREP